MQCPACGREVDDLPHGLCGQCLSERKPFLDAPEVVTVTRCAHCRKLDRGGLWVQAPSEPDDLVRFALPNEATIDPDLRSPVMATELEWEDERNALASVHVTGAYEGHAVERNAEVRVRLRQSVCNDCSREYGGYFEAILQLRGTEERVLRHEASRIESFVTDALERRRAEQRSGAWVSRSDHVRGGLDFYMGSLEVARLVAAEIKSRYGAEYQESGKLVGRKDGRDLYRFTLLVRLPPYVPGDFILYDERPYKLLRHDGRLLTMWDLGRNSKIQREAKRARRLKVIGRAEDERQAVVVSYHDGNLQVLDPVSYKTLDLRVEADLAGKDTVRLFRYEDDVYVIPDETARAPEPEGRLPEGI